MAADLAEARRALERELSALDALSTATEPSATCPQTASRLADARARLAAALALLEVTASDEEASGIAPEQSPEARPPVAPEATARAVFPTRTRPKPRPPVEPQVDAPEPLPERLVEAAEPALAVEATGDVEEATPEQESPAPSPVTVQPLDDLTRIKGIDARLAQRLNRAGLRSIEDIAALTAPDVRSLSAALGLERRITRQSWIEQAALILLREPARAGVQPVLLPIARRPADQPADQSAVVAEVEALAEVEATAEVEVEVEAKVETETETETATEAAPSSPESPQPAPEPAAIHVTRPADVEPLIAAAVNAIRASLIPVEVALPPPPSPRDEPEPEAHPEPEREPEPEPEPEPQPEPPAAEVAPPPGPDELQLIAGLDPESAAALAALGVTRYADIAQFRESDITELDQHLGLGRRIAREQWIEQAAILATGRMTAYANDTARGRRPRTAAPPQEPLPPDPALRALLDAATAPEPTAIVTASEPMPVEQTPPIAALPPEGATAPVAPEAQAAQADAPAPEPTSEPPQSAPAEPPPPPPVPAPRSTPFRLRYVETPADLLAAVDREIEVVGANATAVHGPMETLAAGPPVLAPLEATSAAPSGTSGDLDREYAPPHTDIPQEEAEVLIVPRLDSSPRVTGESSMGKDGALGPPGSLKSRLRKAADGDVAPDFDSHYAYGHAIDEAAVEIVDVETRRPLPRRDASAQAAQAGPSARTSVPRILRTLTGKPPRSE